MIKVYYFVDKVRIDLKSKDFYLPHADHTLDKYNKQYINRVYQYFQSIHVSITSSHYS